MPREFSRTARVAEQIQREIAQMLLREVSDPRLAGVTVSSVEVSRDLAHAKVYVTRLAGGAVEDEVMAALRHASGFLRTGLAHRIKLRSMPDLRFFYDTSALRGERLTTLIEEAVQHDASAHEEEDQDPHG